MLTGTTFQKELVPLRGNNVSHAHKMGFWYVLGFLSKFQTMTLVGFIWESPPPPLGGLLEALNPNIYPI